MQEDKKKSLKSFLSKLLVAVVLVGISIATYKVNLSQLLHDFVLNFFDATVNYDTDDEEIQEDKEEKEQKDKSDKNKDETEQDETTDKDEDENYENKNSSENTSLN